MGAAKAPGKVYRCGAEFELEVVELSQLDGVKAQDVAEAPEIRPFVLSR